MSVNVINYVEADVPPPRTSTHLKDLVEDLTAATAPEDQVDSDGDGLYDKVEIVIGTDFNNTDSDFDLLDDYYEVQIDSDPLDPDTNSDGLSDYVEVNSIPYNDLDGDNLTNIWDYDNDGDGINDEVDLSPFSQSGVHDSFHFNVSMDGRPTFIKLQMRPKNPNNLKLYYQLWNWPDDSEGSMKDMDSSLEDIKVIPQLNLTVNTLPNQADVAAYGILVSDNGMYVPIYPVWENDDIVAFSSQIFYNTSVPMSVLMDAKLMWRVLGYRDEKANALRTYDGHYVSIASEGAVVANASEISLLETFQWIELGENKVALKIKDGPYLSMASNGSIVAQGYEIGKEETFKIVTPTNTTICLMADNGKYLSVEADGRLMADGSLETDSASFKLVDMGYLGEWTILVTYTEAFTLTGFTVSESYEADLGLFYSEDEQETIRAHFLLGYDFLRNSTTSLADMPWILSSYGSSVSNLRGSFSTVDEALVTMSNEMLPTVLDSLPPNVTLPVTIAVEETLKMVEMSQFLSGPYSMGDSYNADLTVEPFITSKALKMNFYETTSYDALAIDDIMRHIGNYQISEEARFNTQTFLLMWNTGEQVITKMGTIHVNSSLPDWFVAFPVGFETMMLFTRAGLGVKAYKSLKLLQAKGWNIASIGKMLDTASTSGFWQWCKMCNKLSDAQEGWAGIKGISKFKKIAKYLEIIGVLVDVGLSVFAGFMIADQIGGHLGKSMGAMYGIFAAVYAIIYALILYGIGEIPIVGWIISLAIVIADLIGGFSDKLMNWLMDVFGPKTDAFVEGWLEDIGVPAIVIWDKDNNGLDVGDRISVEINTTSKTNVTEGDDYYYAYSSYYSPYLVIAAPPGSFSNTSQTGIPPNSQIKKTYGWNYKIEQYETGAWIEPGIGMPNFPVNLRLNISYSLMYRWHHWIFFVPCYHSDPTTGLASSALTTLYYDVFPKDIDDFASWRGITPLDHDGDGLTDVNETNSNPYRYDTDADYLNDKFEVETGLNPSNFDTDMDGLLDSFEITFGTNATNWDTDGDRFPDYQELSGYLININYTGDPAKQFKMRVFSDPRVADTDGDGVDDYMEYLSGLNPRSGDSDGDGVGDVAAPRVVSTYVEFGGDTGTILDYTRIYDIEVDADGNVYVLGQSNPEDHDLGIMSHLWIFDSNLSLVSVWNFTVGTPYTQINFPLAIDDGNGLIHFGNAPNFLSSIDIRTFYLNGMQAGAVWGYKSDIVMWGDILFDVDSDGNVYVARCSAWYTGLGTPNFKVYIKAYVDKYASNRALIDTWGSYGLSLDKFTNIQDIAVDSVYDLIYFADDGQNMTWYIDHPDRPDLIGVYDINGTYLRSISGFNNGSFSIQFNNPTGVDVDSEGNVYVVDAGNYRIHKFDPYGISLVSWGSKGTGEGQFEGTPIRIAVGPEGDVYVTQSIYSEGDWPNRVYRFSQSPKPAPPPPIPDDVPDRDGDGLLNDAETAGWDIVFTNVTGAFTLHVDSDPMLNDTDFDGLSDYIEYNEGLNPRSPDTDQDGVSDFEEYQWHHSPGMNPAHFDTDGEGLPDATELSYGSDPTKQDTDEDGLTDLEEWLLNSDPNDTDTDDDGVSDYQEWLSGTNLLSPDSDGDFMFDGAELSEGTDPNDGDTDNDGLVDGHEILLDTNPFNGDSDGDELPDGFEVDNWLNPLSNDTDGDGLSDSTELEKGTDPWNKDSDFDGIPDGEDLDSNSTQVGNIVLSFDPDNSTYEFAQNLAQYTNVTVVSKEGLLANYTNSPYIVLVGRPDGNSTVGKLIHDLLLDSGDVLTKMIESDANRFVVRYGLWNSTQTIVMLSQPYPTDHLQVLNILRSKIVTINPDSAVVDYRADLAVQYPEGGSLNHTSVLYNYFMIDEIDTVKAADSIIQAFLEKSVSPWIAMNRYNGSTTPFALTNTSGLGNYEIAIGRYLDIIVSENVQNNTADIIDAAMIKIYYRESDLDRTANGYVGDPQDINEDTLRLYLYNETSGLWTKLSEEQDWVIDFGVNTTDIELYGQSYSGYIWAVVEHFSLYGVAGLTYNRPPDISNAHPSIEYIWSPDHKFVNVTVEGVTDPDGDPVTITITDITSDEPTTAGGFRFAPDAYGIGTSIASLRAERIGTGNGRVYIIEFMASDGKGGQTVGTVAVYVPHDKKSYMLAVDPIDDGQYYQATEIN